MKQLTFAVVVITAALSLMAIISSIVRIGEDLEIETATAGNVQERSDDGGVGTLWGSQKQDKSLFVFVSQQRSGSKWVMENIMSFPGIWMKFMEPLSAKSQMTLFGNSTVSGSGVDGTLNARFVDNCHCCCFTTK